MTGILSTDETWVFFKWSTLSVFVVLVAFEIFVMWHVYKVPMPWNLMWGSLALLLGLFIAWYGAWGLCEFWIWGNFL